MKRILITNSLGISRFKDLATGREFSLSVDDIGSIIKKSGKAGIWELSATALGLSDKKNVVFLNANFDEYVPEIYSDWIEKNK